MDPVRFVAGGGDVVGSSDPVGRPDRRVTSPQQPETPADRRPEGVSSFEWNQLRHYMMVTGAVRGGSVTVFTVERLPAQAPCTHRLPTPIHMMGDFFIPGHPIWAIRVMVVGVPVIWALTAHGSEMKRT